MKEEKGFLRCVFCRLRVFQLIQNASQVLQFRIAGVLQHQPGAEALQGFPHLQQRLDLRLAHHPLVIAHDRVECFHRPLAPVVADIDALTRYDLNKAQLLKLDHARADHRTADAHTDRQLPGRRKLFPHGKLAGQNHIFDLLYKQICQRKGGYFLKAHIKASCRRFWYYQFI